MCVCNKEERKTEGNMEKHEGSGRKITNESEGGNIEGISKKKHEKEREK